MYKLNITDFGWNQIDQDFILYSINKNTYYILNETAKVIWDYMYEKKDFCSQDEMVRHIENLYDCDDSSLINKDVEQLMSLFLQIELVTQQ